eukprot:gnl/TRDRNA2_/TRDRNA2_171472_c2_seq1.p1 gnl/TRDRNA2_/TRDRNA2_171472_c2~~gnl/TRDRNA2_/TRDRNA2_171472_c2_seq1.p1  ORF type:complete len:204 (+),score=8.06 gnl/TRDRNA2_/TRDRNA2_171472_c2_seq1:32-643(+)
MVEMKSMHSEIHTGVTQCQSVLMELKQMHSELHCMHRDIHNALRRMTSGPMAGVSDDLDIPVRQEVAQYSHVEKVTSVNELSAKLDVDLLQHKLREEVDKLHNSLAAHICQLRDASCNTQRPKSESSSGKLSSLPAQSISIKVQQPCEQPFDEGDGRQRPQQISQSQCASRDRQDATNTEDNGLPTFRSQWAILERDYVSRLY